MTCQQIEDRLIEFVADSLTQDEKELFTIHISQCPSCTEKMQEIELVWQKLDLYEERVVPLVVQETILQNARRVAAENNAGLTTKLSSALRWLPVPLQPILMGLLTTIVIAIILSFRIDMSLIHPLGLMLAGTLWTGLFALIYYLFSNKNNGEPSYKFLAQASLIAVVIFLAMTFISPLPHSVRFCSNFNLTQSFMERLSTGGTYFLFGSLYALLPVGIATFLSASRAGKNPLLRGTMAGAMFMLLLIPGIFLQCAPFALGVVMGWFGGALIGSLVGGAIGYWIRYRMAGRTG
ncbi:MAG: anti-sigma factor family protein [Calditrichia bacterium]